MGQTLTDPLSSSPVCCWCCCLLLLCRKEHCRWFPVAGRCVDVPYPRDYPPIRTSHATHVKTPAERQKQWDENERKNTRTEANGAQPPPQPPQSSGNSGSSSSASSGEAEGEGGAEFVETESGVRVSVAEAQALLDSLIAQDAEEEAAEERADAAFVAAADADAAEEAGITVAEARARRVLKRRAARGQSPMGPATAAVQPAEEL
jgi:hypothetical protein